MINTCAMTCVGSGRGPRQPDMESSLHLPVCWRVTPGHGFEDTQGPRGCGGSVSAIRQGGGGSPERPPLCPWPVNSPAGHRETSLESTAGGDQESPRPRGEPCGYLTENRALLPPVCSTAEHRGRGPFPHFQKRPAVSYWLYLGWSQPCAEGGPWMGRRGRGLVPGLWYPSACGRCPVPNVDPRLGLPRSPPGGEESDPPASGAPCVGTLACRAEPGTHLPPALPEHRALPRKGEGTSPMATFRITLGPEDPHARGITLRCENLFGLILGLHTAGSRHVE